MEYGGDLGEHMTVSLDKNVDKCLCSETKQVSLIIVNKV